MKQTVEKLNFDTTRNLNEGLIKRSPKQPEQKPPMDPAVKKMIQDFSDVAGMQSMDKMNMKAKELYDRIPGLNEKIEKLNKKMIEVAADIELGKVKREVYQKFENELADLERQKRIALTAIKSIYEEQQAIKKEAIKQVTKKARDLLRPIIKEFDEILYRVEKLKLQEQQIRTAFCRAVSIDTGSSYGYLPPSWDLRIDPILWREMCAKDLLK